jgi:pimeloyl-ACP methyl ester carboxylesterase
LILGCTACGGRESTPARREVLEALGARATMTRDQAMRVMVPYIFDASTPRDLVEEDLAIRNRTTVPNEGFFAQLQAIRSWSGTFARLGSIAVPTLVIHGETDELVPAENGRVIAAAIPNATLVMLPRASHIFFTDQIEASTEAILSFLGVRAAA